MADDTLQPDYTQLEQLSGQIQLLYSTNLGHQPQQVECKLLEHTLMISVEDSLTQPEQILVENNHYELAKQVRTRIHEAIEPQLQKLISQTLGVPVVDLFIDSTLDTSRTNIVAILAHDPSVLIETKLVNGEK